MEVVAVPVVLAVGRVARHQVGWAVGRVVVVVALAWVVAVAPAASLLGLLVGPVVCWLKWNIVYSQQ